MQTQTSNVSVTQKWHRDLEDGINTTPTIAKSQSLYVAGHFHASGQDLARLHRVEPDTTHWRFDDSYYGPIRYPLTAQGEDIYFTNGIGNIVCVDGNEGETRWTFNAGREFPNDVYLRAGSPLLYHEGHIYGIINDSDHAGTVVSLDEKGKLVWKYTLRETVRNPDIVGEKLLVENIQYGCPPSVTTHALDVKTGKRVDVSPGFRPFEPTPSFGSGHLYHIQSQIAIGESVREGKIMWHQPLIAKNQNGNKYLGDPLQALVIQDPVTSSVTNIVFATRYGHLFYFEQRVGENNQP